MNDRHVEDVSKRSLMLDVKYHKTLLMDFQKDLYMLNSLVISPIWVPEGICGSKGSKILMVTSILQDPCQDDIRSMFQWDGDLYVKIKPFMMLVHCKIALLFTDLGVDLKKIAT